MQVEWRSIENLRELPIDMWILVPTGMGVNRLLKTNGDISDSWLKRLELFLGMERSKIIDMFYSKEQTLFPNMEILTKEEQAIKKSAKIYQNRLKEVFKEVSNPYELKNQTGSVMYHLFLTSNNKTAIKIGNNIVKKYNK